MIEPMSSAKLRRFGRDKRDTLPRACRECEVRFACHGECPRNRFIKTPNGDDGLNYLCAGLKHFFRHIDEPMIIMEGLLAQRRAPAEIMHWYEMEDARRAQAYPGARPNDDCPCGSGKKFKRCHGAKGRDTSQ